MSSPATPFLPGMDGLLLRDYLPQKCTSGLAAVLHFNQFTGRSNVLTVLEQIPAPRRSLQASVELTLFHISTYSRTWHPDQTKGNMPPPEAVRSSCQPTKPQPTIDPLPGNDIETGHLEARRSDLMLFSIKWTSMIYFTVETELMFYVLLKSTEEQRVRKWG